MTIMQKLTSEAIEEHLTELSDWSLTGASIQRTFGFENFRSAMQFVNQVAELAERADHHPDIMIRSGKVTLTLTTHSAAGGGGVTEMDIDFAKEADDLMAVCAER